MTYIGTILTLFVPAVLAAGLHAHLMHMKKSAPNFAGLVVFYTFVIAWLLCCIKLARGKGAFSVADSFNTVKNFVVYGLLATLLALGLPFCAKKLLGWCCAKNIEAEAIPDAVKKNAEKTSAETSDADVARVKRVEKSLAAQESEMVHKRTRVVPSRKETGEPVKMLYNIGTRDTKTVPKTMRQRLTWGAIYAFLVVLVIVIVFSVLNA